MWLLSFYAATQEKYISTTVMHKSDRTAILRVRGNQPYLFAHKSFTSRIYCLSFDY